MNTSWSPKPLLAPAESPLFEWVEAPTVVKGLSPIQRQRLADGTPHTVTGRTSLHAPDPVLALPESMVKKGSLVEKYDERPKQPIQDPVDPMSVIKSYLAHKPEAPESDSKKNMAKSMEKMKSAIQDVLAKTGAK